MKQQESEHRDEKRGPYCGNCGYSFVGLTESSRCPECGKPIVDVLVRDTQMLRRGKRYRSPVHLFGLPLIDIAIGPSETELRGKARGIIAIGDIAVGWFAFGGVALGFVAIGGLAVGLAAMGGLAVGGVAALGGAAIGTLAIGGGAAGGAVAGGGSIGYVAQGGGAVGYYARGGDATGVYTQTFANADPQASEFFKRYAWLFGKGPPINWLITQSIWTGVAALLVAAFFGFAVLIAYVMRPVSHTDQFGDTS